MNPVERVLANKQTWAITCADVLDGLRSLPDGCVHCCVTSPPYWGLRDYGVAGQAGLEPTPEAYVTRMVGIFRELRRVIRGDGTLWLNIGTSYATSYNESERYVMRSDLTHEEAAFVLNSLSALWGEQAPTEPEVPTVLPEDALPTGELPQAAMQKMPQAVHDSQEPDGARPGDLLLPVVCQVREPDAQETKSNRGLRDVPEAIQQVQCRDEEDEGQESLLQPELLVSVQSEGQSLSLAGRPERADVRRGSEVAAGGHSTGQGVPDLPQREEAGGSPHSAVLDPRSGAVGTQQRPDALSRLPRQVPVSRDGLRGDSWVHRFGPSCGLALKRHAIPEPLRRFFRPEWVIKPKDDHGIPWLLAQALRADGWYLRSEIIWAKRSPMTESVRDRPTKAHEQVFLLAKARRYFYDRVGGSEKSVTRIRQRLTPTSRQPKGQPRTAAGVQNPVAQGGTSETRNARSVWTLSNEPYKGAHFATMPTELVRRCLKAGISEHGVCPACASPWKRLIAKERVPTRPGTNSKINRASLHEDSPYQSHKGDIYGNRDAKRHCTRIVTTGWAPGCSCETGEPMPALVLDPFAGAGTVPMVARRLGARAIGFDLNPDYVAMAARRILDDNPLMNALTA